MMPILALLPFLLISKKKTLVDQHVIARVHLVEDFDIQANLLCKSVVLNPTPKDVSYGSTCTTVSYSRSFLKYGLF